MKRKTALITGATSGIGRATAEYFAKHDINLILCGRRQERLDTIQKALQRQTDVHTLNFDVSDKIAVFEAIDSLPENFKTIDLDAIGCKNHTIDSRYCSEISTVSSCFDTADSIDTYLRKNKIV